MRNANSTAAGSDEKCMKILGRGRAEDSHVNVEEDYIKTGR